MLAGYKTYLGILIMVLTVIAKAVGADIPIADETVIVVVGGIVAWLGRWLKERRAPDPPKTT